MENLDAATVADIAVRLGLLSSQQVEECWEVADKKTAKAMEFLRFMERKGHLTPWQSQKLVRGDFDGFFLGGYKILYKVASGSFGRVFRAEDPQTGRVVAINWNNKALVDFQDGAWYDITPSRDFLTKLDPAEGKAKYKNVNSAQPIPDKQS